MEYMFNYDDPEHTGVSTLGHGTFSKIYDKIGIKEDHLLAHMFACSSVRL